MIDLTPDQTQQLRDLGITVTGKTISQPPLNISDDNKTTPNLPPNIGYNQNPPISGTKPVEVLKTNLFPLLSISGLTLISFGGLFLLKSKLTSAVPVSPVSPLQNSFPTPTQVPKSIQHYLLTSQQYFTQALAAQSSSPASTTNLLNQSILTATEAIKTFPGDYRGYEQRGRIYQSLIDSQPQFLSSAISDFSSALRLNPNSSDLTRALATLYARKGDSQSTLNYLSQTINLEPTKAQNFYDLAKLQQQVGLLPEALSTYNRLLTLVSDPAQKQTVESEKTAIEKLVSQNKLPALTNPTSPSPIPSVPLVQDGPLIQADAGTGLIIAAPETSSNITVNYLSASNSLSGNGTLPAKTSQIVVSNTNLTSSSQVYVTATSGGKNQVLQVLSRSQDSFTVGLDSPINEDIVFKWWIVN